MYVCSIFYRLYLVLEGCRLFFFFLVFGIGIVLYVYVFFLTCISVWFYTFVDDKIRLK